MRKRPLRSHALVMQVCSGVGLLLLDRALVMQVCSVVKSATRLHAERLCRPLHYDDWWMRGSEISFNISEGGF